MRKLERQLKAEETEKSPKLNLLKPDGVRKQADEVITDILIAGQWMPIVPGSFHFYVTNDGKENRKSVPFIQFDVPDGIFGNRTKRVEVFPQTVGGYAYNVSEE